MGGALFYKILSRPEIALHKKSAMKEKEELLYVKRTQRDYSLSFKLQVVSEVESEGLSIKGALRKYGIQSHGTVLNWIRKYGTFDREYQIQHLMNKSPEQKILELEQRVKLLEKQKASLEKQIEIAEEKAIFFDMMIGLAEKELKVPIRKKSLPGQSKNM